MTAKLPYQIALAHSGNHAKIPTTSKEPTRPSKKPALPKSTFLRLLSVVMSKKVQTALPVRLTRRSLRHFTGGIIKYDGLIS